MLTARRVERIATLGTHRDTRAYSKETPMTRMCVAVLLLPAAFALAASAQQPPEKKDPQSSYEPRSGPGAGQKFLEKFVGDWDVAKTFHPRSGEPNTAKGVCKQTMVHNGRFLNSEFVFGEG